MQQNNVLPQEIYFACADENWKINYLFSPIKTRGMITDHREFVLLGEVDDHSVCLQILRDWVLQKAEQLLAPQLHSLSQELDLNFQGLQIRQQKTRWGSCSAQKKINLNYQLVFLAPELVRYIMIHELCHTRFLNHSKRFWQLVAKHDPDWQMHRLRCRRAEKDMPSWLADARV
jgi:predicted metal-dependent hydrolase